MRGFSLNRDRLFAGPRSEQYGNSPESSADPCGSRSIEYVGDDRAFVPSILGIDPQAEPGTRNFFERNAPAEFEGLVAESVPGGPLFPSSPWGGLVADRDRLGFIGFLVQAARSPRWHCTFRSASNGLSPHAMEPTPIVLPDPPLQPRRPGEPPTVDIPEPPDPAAPWDDPEPPEPLTPRPPELPSEDDQ